MSYLVDIIAFRRCNISITFGFKGAQVSLRSGSNVVMKNLFTDFGLGFRHIFFYH
jgi:hypothetical protein